MLVQTLRRARELVRGGAPVDCSDHLAYFLHYDVTADHFRRKGDRSLEAFGLLDDYDVISGLKTWRNAADPLLAFLSASLLDRRLFRLELSNTPFAASYVDSFRQQILEESPFDRQALPYLVFKGQETNSAYSTSKYEILILHKDGRVLPMSESADHGIQSQLTTKYYLCYPKARKGADLPAKP